MTDAPRRTFISFSSRDQVKATSICQQLERENISCWISCRDVAPGANFQASIVAALQEARLMVFVFSENTNQSTEVLKELALASAMKMNVMPVRIADVRPNGALMYELATRQWVDAFDNWDAAMKRLVATARLQLAHAITVPEPVTSEVAVQVASALAAVGRAEPPNPAAPAVPAAPIFSKEQLEAARLALSYHLGPVADVLVRRASTKATTLSELHDQLAAHIRSSEAQTAFRKRVSMMA